MPITAPKTSKAGKRKKFSVTIKDIAQELGVSFQAVSQALNPRKNTSRIAESTRQRILKKAEQMGYRRHQAARTLRSGRSGLLGVLIFDHPRHVMHYRLHHVLAEIHRAGYRPFVHLAETRANARSMEGCLTMLDAQVEGLIFVDPIGLPEETSMQQLRDREIPMVSLGSYQWRTITSYQVDRYRGYRELAQHLINNGCRSFALIRDEEMPASQNFFHRFINDMTRGFYDAIADGSEQFGPMSAHLEPVAAEIEVKAAQDRDIHLIYRPGYYGMRNIIQSGWLPDAVLCQADCWAHGALLALHEAGLRVPGNLLLTGFGNEPSSSAGNPPITTVAQPFAELSRLAVANVVGQIARERENEPGKVITLPGHLIVRKSSQTTKVLSIA